MGVITFDGVSSDSLNIHVERPPDYEIPERICEVIDVPGRHGQLLIDTGAYRNVNREYFISIGEEGSNFKDLSKQIVKLLNGRGGYKRLEDSYEPDVYMIAAYRESAIISNIEGQAGRVQIVFDRKPQKFIKHGDTPIPVPTEYGLYTGEAYNEYTGDAKPIIHVYGSGAGNVYIQNGSDDDPDKILHTIKLSNIPTWLTVDCELEDVYKETTNLNVLAKITNGFPTIKPGKTVKFWYDGLVTGLEYVPRWWRL